MIHVSMGDNYSIQIVKRKEFGGCEEWLNLILVICWLGTNINENLRLIGSDKVHRSADLSI